MSPTPARQPPDSSRIVDYDSGFDYLAFWGNRDYERWVEARTLRRLLPRLGRLGWLADFGGGFGRNAGHYARVADHAVLVDYSVTQLTRAAERLAPEIGAGRLHLIRADLASLPLIDSAVEGAMVVRVLHHMTNVEACLAEIARTVGRRWLVDVPIKHHALASLRGARQGTSRQLRDSSPVVTGSTEFPFYTFQLAAIRACLRRAGFRSQSAASVNNFRRWDQSLPPSLVHGLSPAVYGLELVAQRLGRGWWGPSQFLLATRSHPRDQQLAPARPGTPPALEGLARRTRCPFCRSELDWSGTEAGCSTCGKSYPRRAGFWDFSIREPSPTGVIPDSPEG
ncbi:MAG: class I SAM-dependent methyltransferase [Rhodanobacteraceae bacterium]